MVSTVVTIAVDTGATGLTGKLYVQMTDDPAQAAEECGALIAVAHERGLHVWVDVVFNHTGEGDDRGRTFSFRGLDNNIYYLLTQDGRYQNFTGCGTGPVAGAWSTNCS